MCKRVDRPNFGLCLDTFQIAGMRLFICVSGGCTLRTDRPYAARAYADPTSGDSKLPGAQERLADSLSALSKAISPEKIFYFQISDGSYRHGVDALKQTAEEQGIDPLYAWSNAWRPLPFQDEIEGRSGVEGYGGYLPVVEICEAVVKTGWKGPWSYEVGSIGLSRQDLVEVLDAGVL